MFVSVKRKGIKTSGSSCGTGFGSMVNVFFASVAVFCLLWATALSAQETAPETTADEVQETSDEAIVAGVEEATGDPESSAAESEISDDSTPFAIPVEEPAETINEALPAEADAADQNPTGDPVVEVSEPVSEEAEPALFISDLSTYESPLNQVDTYLDAIDAAEIENGAYSSDLSDLYLGLGQAFLESREFEEAKEAFQQGMQIVRVNFGLNSPEQTNYLFAVADIESIQGNRRAANEVISHAYLINARNFGKKAPEMIPVLTQILDWYSTHRPVNAPNNFYDDLERAGSITSEMAEIVELDKGLGHPDTTAMYRKQGQIHWHTAKYVLGRGISVEPGVIMATGKPSYSVHVKEVSIKEHFREGREAFTKVAASVSMDENSSMIEKAEAIAQVGDWNLAFGKKQAAGQNYIRAYQVLAEQARSEEVADEYFRDPVPVRFMNDNLQSHGSDIQADLFIPASITVTEGGRALKVDLIDPPSEIPGDQLRLINREINGMHFRPALGDGVPVKTENFIFEYPLTITAEES